MRDAPIEDREPRQSEPEKWVISGFEAFVAEMRAREPEARARMISEGTPTWMTRSIRPAAATGSSAVTVREEVSPKSADPA